MKQSANIGQRRSSLELLRITTIILITFNHIASIGGATGSQLPFNHYLALFYMMWGKVSVNMFVMLGCYFLTERNIKSSQIIRILVEVFFFATIMNVLDVIVTGHFQGLYQFCKGYFYWYVFAYIVMLLLIPLIKKSRLLCSNGCLFFLFAILSTIPTLTRDGMWLPGRAGKLLSVFRIEVIIGPFWFCFLYLLIKWLKKRDYLLRLSTAASFLLIIISMGIMYVSTILLQDSYMRDMYSMPCLVCSLTIFSFFIRLKLQQKMWINHLASFSFGIFLLQAHGGSEQVLWQTLLHTEKWSNHPAFLPWSIIITILICGAGIILGFVRIWLGNLPAIRSVKESMAEKLDKCWYRHF